MAELAITKNTEELERLEAEIREDIGGFIRVGSQGLHQIVTGYRSTTKRRNQIAEATGLRVEDLWPADGS